MTAMRLIGIRFRVIVRNRAPRSTTCSDRARWGGRAGTSGA